MQLTSEFKSFIRRRTKLFLDRAGMALPLSFLLEEAYLQGMRDAVQTMTSSVDHPRWVADMTTMELTERQADNSYCPSFKMVPIIEAQG